MSSLVRRVQRMLAAISFVAIATTSAANHAAAADTCEKPDKIRVMIFASVFNQMVTYMAHDADIFEKYCLDATLVPVNTGPAGMAQLQAGSLHFSDSSFDNTLVARQRELPIKVVVGGSAGVPYSLVAATNLDLPNEAAGYPAVMKDLVGKKVGVFGLGTGSEAFVKTLFRGAGLDPNSPTYVAVGSTPTQLAALQNGAVDAVIMADPGQDLAVRGGSGKIIVDLRKAGSGPKEIQDLVGTFQVKVASEEFARKNPDLLDRYIQANEAAVAWIKDPNNFDALLKLMKERVKLGEDVKDADAIFEDLVRLYADFSSASISRKSVEAWNAFQMAAGNIPSPIPFEEVIWEGAPVTD